MKRMRRTMKRTVGAMLNEVHTWPITERLRFAWAVIWG